MSHKTLPLYLPLACWLIACLACSRLSGAGPSHAQATANADATQATDWTATAMARPALVFTPEQLPPATAGEPYTATITITQNATPVGNMGVKLADLPPGLEFTFIKGQDAAAISGTPVKPGTYPFTISAGCFGTNIPGQVGDHAYVLVVK